MAESEKTSKVKQFIFNISDSNITKMPKRKCTFNISLQNKYPFIKQRSGASDVTCDLLILVLDMVVPVILRNI